MPCTWHQANALVCGKVCCYFANQEEENLEWKHPRFSFYVVALGISFSSVIMLLLRKGFKNEA